MTVPKPIIDLFPVNDNRVLRYAVMPTDAVVQGSVILLQEHGDYIEDYSNLMSMLSARGFYSATFDWFGQGGSGREKKDQSGGHISDFRACIKDLNAMFEMVFLPDLPGPFYILGSGMGGLIALAANDSLQNQIRRMVVVSPLLQPLGRCPGGAYHYYSRFMSDIGLSLMRTNRKITQKQRETDPIRIARKTFDRRLTSDIGHPTLGWFATMLDAAGYVCSPDYFEHMLIPTLFLVSNHDKTSNPAITRKLAEHTRMGAGVTLTDASYTMVQNKRIWSNQFWSAFDAFIPGTGAPEPGRSLESDFIYG